MTQGNAQHTCHGHQHGTALSGGAEAGLADLLDLDAELLGGYLDEATAWTAGHLTAAPRLIVDLGAGTGIGSLALARRFPDSAVVAVDRSRLMLDRVESTAREQGLADRVTGLQADMNGGWPAVGPADLIWASSSLHELPDPAKAMRHAFDALVPDGLFVVVELDSLPRFLPEADLEQRLHEVLDRKGWNHHPDWRPHLERAGFKIADQRGLAADADPSAPGAGRYADGYLRRMRPAVEDALPAADLAALDRLLDQDSPDALLRRQDLRVRSSRTAWAARRP